MKVKQILGILFFGIALMILGVWGKLVYQPWASLVMTIATFVQILALLLGIYKLFTSKKYRDFLDS
jgi:hypothetical protein